MAVAVLSPREACELLSKLLEEGYLLACVGTYLRGDDRACLELCTRLLSGGIHHNVALCEYGLENCLPEVIERGSRGVVVCDVAYVDGLEAPAGSFLTFAMEELEEVEGLVTTHRLPLRVVMSLIREAGMSSGAVFLGVIPRSLNFSLDMSESVEKAVSELVSCVKAKFTSQRNRPI